MWAVEMVAMLLPSPHTVLARSIYSNRTVNHSNTTVMHCYIFLNVRNYLTTKII